MLICFFPFHKNGICLGLGPLLGVNCQLPLPSYQYMNMSIHDAEKGGIPKAELEKGGRSFLLGLDSHQHGND